jgi:hypothetical protein
LQWRLQEPWTFGPWFFGGMFVDFNILVVSRFHDDKIEKYYIYNILSRISIEKLINIYPLVN